MNELMNIFSIVMEMANNDLQSTIRYLKEHSEELLDGRMTGRKGYLIEDNNKEVDRKAIEFLKALCNEQDYNTYLSLLKEGNDIFKKLYWKFDKNVIMGQDYGFSNLSSGRCRFVQAAPEKVIPGRHRFFHVSTKSGLTKLSPFFKSYHNGVVEALYPNKRVYFGIDHPINRNSTFNWDGSGHVYEYKPTGNVSCKQDRELGYPACFIETTVDLPVIDVTDEVLKNKDKFSYDIFNPSMIY